jgi:hypothetical protein
MLKLYRKRSVSVVLCHITTLALVFQCLAPLDAFALTSGPSTPEVQSFEPIGTTQMVDPFTGDFNYNIPLLDVGGYPINIAYHAGIGMEQEASWVGLGWNINPGVINRNVRGIADDFNGDEIGYEMNVKPNTITSLSMSSPLKNLEVFGFKIKSSKKASKNFELGITLNNYKGVGFNWGYDNKFSSSSSSGFEYTPSFQSKEKDIKFKKGNNNLSVSKSRRLTFGLSSRDGIQYLNFSKLHRNKKSNSTASKGIAGDFSYHYYTPVSSARYTSLKAQIDLTSGTENVGVFPGTKYSLGITENYIKGDDKSFSRRAYGYLNAENADDFSVMDKSENFVGFDRFTNYLKHSTHTYDQFSVSGQGVGGSFRPFRTQVGAVADASYSTNNSFSSNGFGFNGSIEFGAGNVTKVGFDVRSSVSLYQEGRWKKCKSCDNQTFENLKFSQSGQGFDEAYYFKNEGDFSLVDDQYYNAVKNDKAIKIALEDIDFLPSMSPSYVYDYLNGSLSQTPDNENIEISNPIKRSENNREKRKDVIQTLNNMQRKAYGVETKIYDYSNGKSEVNHSYRANHHLSEITSISHDGSRYVYGLAAYNLNQRDVSFAIQGVDLTTSAQASGIVSYDANCPTSSNEKGIDHFYQATNTPAYAYAYHLTCILSPDYADLTGDGPTPDDFGNYTKFNYQKLSNEMDWRVPGYNATHEKGLKSNLNDDRAHYSYGKKEIWYLKSIETKTHVAIFDLSDREDGLGTNGENVLGSQTDAYNNNLKLKKLDRIRLYTREQISDPTTLSVSNSQIPVKVVHFAYSYDLCSNVPNNSGIVSQENHPLSQYFGGGSNSYNWDKNAKKGKLTLNKIWFTYGNSSKGELNPYLFEYDNNVDYKPNQNDRWGVYKPKNNGNTVDPYGGNDDLPYTEQGNRAQTDLYASMWSLTDIHLPSGGVMHVNYESDDYALVQDMKAMEMTKVMGLVKREYKNNTMTYGSLTEEFGRNLSGKDELYIVIDIMDGKTLGDYLDRGKEQTYLGFKMLIELKDGIKEYIDDYIEVDYDKCHIQTVSGNQLLYLCIKSKEIDSETLNHYDPIRIIAMDYVRKHMPYLIHAGEDYINSPQSSAEKAASLLFSSIGEVTQMAIGVYPFMDTKKLCRKVDLNHSFVRLNSPTKKKIGGGHRVKSIIIDDNWNSVSGEKDHSYGQVFQYEVDGISTGVASYEPLVGGEEIPQRQPQKRIEKVPAGTNYHLTDELPVCEDLYPSASVGYSKVIVRELKPEDLQLIDPSTNQYYSTKEHANGFTEYQFYTAADFPTISKATKLDKCISNYLAPEFFGLNITKAIASQGYSVEVNNMHGQARAISTFDNKGKLVTRTEYVYKHDGKNLINKINLLKKDGTVVEASSGVNIETIVEPLESESINVTAGVQTNFDGFVMGIIPAPTWSIIPNWNYTHNQVKTAVVTKLIQKYGILEKVIVIRNGSRLDTKNLAWDAETGEVLLTATQTMHGDYNYSLDIPAHFAYEGMDGAYKNINATFSATCSSGVVNYTYEGLLTPGDELEVLKQDGTYAQKAWVLDVDAQAKTASLIDKDGAIYPNGSYDFKVLRSGHRNQQNAPLANITMIENPIVNGRYDSYSGVNKNSIISASAIEYSDNKSLYSIAPNLPVKKCDGNLVQSSITSTFSDDQIEYKYYDYNDASLTGIIDPANRFMPCLNQAAPCSVNYVNPYALGIKGVYYPYKTLGYYDKLNPERSSSVNLLAQNPDYNTSSTRFDGLIKDFFPYWNVVTNGYWTHADIDANNDNINDKWTWTSLSEMIDQNGNELQSIDAFGIQSAALYGYGKKIAIGVAQNCKQNELLFDGFEEYSTAPLYACPPASYAASSTYLNYNNTAWHWLLWPNLTKGRASINTKESHTGKQSLELGHGLLEIPFNLPSEPSYPSIGTLQSRFFLDKTNTISGFYPDCYKPQGQSSYLLTFWAKFDKKKVKPLYFLQYNNGTSWVDIPFKNDGDIIWVDGWGRITLKVVIPQAAQGKKMRMQIAKGIYDTNNNFKTEPSYAELTSAQNYVYIDDIRIIPEYSNMKSFVYDNFNYRLMAVLDENHFATFYEYDDEGNLSRTKKETERGIMTIQESRINIKKRP